MLAASVSPCPRCQGAGSLPTGPAMREARQRVSVGLREMARRLGVSSGYLRDLEAGRRKWRASLVVRYRSVLPP